jgi:hypothetical protein
MGKDEIEKYLTHLATKQIETTMIYIHIIKELNKNDIQSPLDFPDFNT